MTDPKKPVSADETDEATEEVGYCKPPKHSQFKKGNKFGKGRPKGAKNLKTIVNEVLGKKVAVKVAGKTRKMTSVEVAMHRLATKSSEGDLKAIAAALDYYERYGPQEDPGGPEPEKLSRDMEAMRAFLDMQDQLNPAKTGEEGDSDGA